MKGYIYIIVGFICGIFIVIICKIAFQCKHRRRNRVSMIIPRRHIKSVIVAPQNLNNNNLLNKILINKDSLNKDSLNKDADLISIDYTISDDSNDEEIFVRHAENV